MRLNALNAIFIAVIMAFTPPCLAYEIKITRDELNRQIGEHFPVSQQYPFISYTLSKPDVRINSGANQISIGANVNISVPGFSEVSGFGRIAGQLEYRSAEQTFYLYEPKFVDLNLNSADLNKPAEETIISTLKNLQLPVILLYRLPKETLQENWALRALNSVNVRGNELILDMKLSY